MRLAAAIFAAGGFGFGALIIANVFSSGFHPVQVVPMLVVASLFYLSYGLVRHKPGSFINAAVAAIFIASAAACILGILVWYALPGEIGAMLAQMPGTLGALLSVLIGFTAAAVFLLKARGSQPNNRIERAREP